MRLPPIYFFSSSSTKSGGARQAAYLARGLMARGHDLTFFVTHDSDLPELDAEISWIRLPAERRRWKTGIEEHLPRKSKFIFQAFHNKAVKKLALWGLLWRYTGGVCFGYRGLMKRPGNPLPYWSPGIRSFFVNSRACADVLARILVRRKRLHVVYNAIPEGRIDASRPAEEVRRELGLSDTDTVFGAISGSKPVKGTSELLQAFANLGSERARLVIVGTTPERWRDGMRGLEDRIRIVPKTESIGDYLRIFDVFMLPSLSESMPNTLLEAVSAGLPVLASRVGGVPEIVDGNGLLFEPGDVRAMTGAMREMLDNAGLRAHFAARSAELKSEFTIANKVDKVEAVYALEAEKIHFSLGI